MEESNGVFISFEGGDHSGKTTQISLLAQALRQAGRSVLVTREPGGTELGTTLRKLIQHGPDDVDPRCEALMYAADRAYHVATVIRPALRAGSVVLTDRYLDSSVAYQGAARNLGATEIRNLSLWATQNLLPVRTVLLDGDPQTLTQRRTGEPDRLERESLDFHRAVRQEFLTLAKAEPNRFAVVDATADLTALHHRIADLLKPQLGADFSPLSIEQVAQFSSSGPRP